MARLKKRQKVILRALEDLGGLATARQIAEAAGMNTGGVSQTLRALLERGYVRHFFKSSAGVILWKATLKGIHVRSAAPHFAGRDFFAGSFWLWLLTFI